jgi:hypothetical protein
MARRRPTEATANPARGAALVVGAVLVGLFLLRNGLDTSETITTKPNSSTDGTAGADSSTDGSTAGATTATETTVAVRAAGQVPTIVLNGSGVKGAAKKYSTFLAAAGYDLTNPDGANSTADVTATQVLFGPGFDREAAALATLIGAPSTGVTAIGSVLPGTTAGASVIVVLGPDLGSKTPGT